MAVWRVGSLLAVQDADATGQNLQIHQKIQMAGNFKCSKHLQSVPDLGTVLAANNPTFG